MIEKYECPECAETIEWDDQREDEYIQCPHCQSRLKSPYSSTFKAGMIIGDYEIIRRLGIGGMGEVYLAEQKSMMRPVALKVLQKSLVEDHSYLERFYREVRTLAQIEHPNVVKAIETGYIEEESICYFSMRYVEGQDLKKRLDADGKIPEIDALNVIMHVGLALQYVWDKYQLIHRDIKPANIIVTDEGEVKLMDLGISKSMKDESRADLTMAGMMVGSPYYVSPEQAKADKDLDFRADMYSLGASFYHMLTGKLPFDSENAMAIIASHLTDPVPDPRKLAPQISKKSVKIIHRMMKKSRDDRYPSWDDALDDIEDAITGLSNVDIGRTTSLQPAVDLRSMQTTGKLPSAVSPPATADHRKKPETEGVVNQIQNSARGNSPLTGIISNLYIRFVVLVMILFLTFVAFFTVIKKGIRERHDRDAARKMNAALNYIANMPKDNHGFRQAYAMLLDVKSTGSRKYLNKADVEIDKLKENAFKHREQTKKELAGKALRELKSRSYRLESLEKYHEAAAVWKEYQRSGAFADILNDEIRKAILYLENKIRENTSEDGGID